MKSDNLPIHQLLDLISSYQVGATELNSFCFKSELLVVDIRPCMSSEDFSKAMNCVCVLEEINALILDEAWLASQIEYPEIERQLALLKN